MERRVRNCRKKDASFNLRPGDLLRIKDCAVVKYCKRYRSKDPEVVNNPYKIARVSGEMLDLDGIPECLICHMNSCGRIILSEVGQ